MKKENPDSIEDNDTSTVQLTDDIDDPQYKPLNITMTRSL